MAAAAIADGKGDKSGGAGLVSLLSTARKRAPVVNIATALSKSLGEEEMRSDFYNIVKDLEARANAYVSSTSVKKFSTLTVVIDGNGRLVVGADRYCVGDMVSLTSSLSGETFSGIIVVITSNEVSDVAVFVRVCLCYYHAFVGVDVVFSLLLLLLLQLLLSCLLLILLLLLQLLVLIP